MTGNFHRRLRGFLAAALAAALCWFIVPGTSLDVAAFKLVARGFANPPFFISGNGSHTSPWRLRTLSSTGNTDPKQAPVIVSLGDDIEGFFQSSPPSPVDLAVVLTNFHRLGVKKAATGAVFAWDSPDPIGLVALEKALGKFDSLVMAAPLSRGAVPESIPTAFRNASVAASSIKGDISLLPVVNRIPLPGIILGAGKTMAGFQSLESEKPGGPEPLLARWEDRVLPSFALLVVLQRLDLEPSAMEIRLGESIQLGANGPIVPIDRYGRLSLKAKPISPFASIPAEAVIDAGEDWLPEHAPAPVVLADERSGAEPRTRAFSAALPGVIASIASDSGLSPERINHRLQPSREALLLLAVALAAAIACGLQGTARNTMFLVLSTACIVAQFLAFAFAERWLPGIASLSGVLAAFAIGFRSAGRTSVPASITEPKPVPRKTSTVEPQAPAPSPQAIVEKEKSPPKKPTVRPKKRRR